jgi:hypothetical protein
MAKTVMTGAQPGALCTEISLALASRVKARDLLCRSTPISLRTDCPSRTVADLFTPARNQIAKATCNDLPGNCAARHNQLNGVGP